MTPVRNALASLFLITLLAACGQPASDTNVTSSNQTENDPSTGHTKDIAWFEGSVDDAFAAAKEQGKPVYLYWGAIWCPPCQEIKNTVFKSPEFLALTDLFVPVYLDGDTAQAQEAGEKFGVKGYPTMIVFTPAGDELTRIPGGIDISQYNTILELSLNQLTPTSELVRIAIDDPTRLSEADLTQLAYYSWGQDAGALPGDAPENLFESLANSAKPSSLVNAARFYMNYLVGRFQANTDENPVSVANAMPWLDQILASDALILSNWDSIAYWPEVVAILDMTDVDRAALQTRWADRVKSLRHSASLSTAEKLSGWFPALYYHFESTDEPLPQSEMEVLRADIANADRITTNATARQSVINQARFILQQAKLNEDAKNLLLAELDKAVAPYYFMSSLGAMAEDEGKTVEAIAWFKRAYDESDGAATRFQWGASYVRALIRMQPDNEALIVNAAESLIAEMADADELFTGRNFRVLRSLNRQLVTWQETHQEAAVEQRIARRLNTLCATQPEGTLGRENCTSLTGA